MSPTLSRGCPCRHVTFCTFREASKMSLARAHLAANPWCPYLFVAAARGQVCRRGLGSNAFRMASRQPHFIDAGGVVAPQRASARGAWTGKECVISSGVARPGCWDSMPKSGSGVALAFGCGERCRPARATSRWSGHSACFPCVSGLRRPSGCPSLVQHLALSSLYDLARHSAHVRVSIAARSLCAQSA